MDERVPRAYLPLKQTYIAVGKILEENVFPKREYYNMSEDEFVGKVMKLTGGSADPNYVRKLYHDLIIETGLTEV